MKRKIFIAARPLVLLLTIIICLLSACRHSSYTRIDGFAEGTTYNIIYDSRINYQSEIECLLQQFELSLSAYDKNSIISKINRNEDVAPDSFFIECFRLSQYVFEQTDGAFDISASPLFNLWGFGMNENRDVPSQALIDSVKAFCGMDKVRLYDGHIIKSDPRMQLNCNAIAKGYSVDVVARFLDSRGIANYMVEIGGEVFCKGVNAQGKLWNIGIDKPIDANYAPGADLQAVAALSGKAIATSGNYRRFFVKENVKYAHIIDPRNGYSVRHNLLSASVIDNSCSTADAYATALMVMGTDSAKRFLERHPELDAFLIYADSGQLQTYATQGFCTLQTLQ